jgi:N6-adenosine-specific RNA methylase IME4
MNTAELDAPETDGIKLDATQPISTIPGYFIPQNSVHLHGSIQDLRDQFLATAPVFDIIVLDPPWPNKSAKRKQTGGYATAAGGWRATRDLLSLVPVPTRLAPDGLVAVWVTNKHALVEMLTAPAGGVLDTWGLELVAEWIWLKVTAKGEPMVGVDSCWRKPWERLLIARRKGGSGSGRVRLEGARRVLIGVPDLHSRKPNLRPLLDDVLPSGYKALEVFARNLTAGWWGWGDEVLRFQELSHWATLPDEVAE